MKLAFIIASLGPGGAERALISLANELCKDHEITIIKFDLKQSSYEINAQIKLLCLPFMKRDSLLKRIKALLAKRAFLRQNTKDFDALISFLDTTNIFCVLSRLKPILIGFEHSSHTYLKSNFLRFLRRLTYKNLDALFVLHKKDKEYYQAFIKNVEVMPNACSFANNCLDYKNKQDLIIFVGRLDKNKNARLFLAALKHVNLPFKAQIIGNGEELECLRKKCKKYDLNVDFIPHCKDMQSIYKRAKIIVLCSTIEGLPSVLIEAAFFGVARISTPYKLAFDELLKDNTNAIIANDEYQIANAITRLLSDDALYKELTKNAHLSVQKYNPSCVAKKLINYVLSLKQARCDIICKIQKDTNAS